MRIIRKLPQNVRTEIEDTVHFYRLGLRKIFNTKAQRRHKDHKGSSDSLPSLGRRGEMVARALCLIAAKDLLSVNGSPTDELVDDLFERMAVVGQTIFDGDWFGVEDSPLDELIDLEVL